MNESGKDLRQILFNGLNEHGFIFQEKCIEELNDNASQTKWKVVGTEYPVNSPVKSTRIDIVLKDTKNYSPENHRIYTVVECKRVNPNLSYWLFGKPISPSNSQAKVIRLQAGYSSKEDYSIKWSQQECIFNVNSILIDNWWLQITQRGKHKYDSSPQPIEDAFWQVFTGVSGLAQEIYGNIQRNPSDYSVLFVPVVITTAPLYYAGYDLKDVDLASGHINKERVFFGESIEKPDKLDWIQVNYPTSIDSFPANFNKDFKINLFSGLRESYQRSIFIVNSEHIIRFFLSLHLSY